MIFQTDMNWLRGMNWMCDVAKLYSVHTWQIYSPHCISFVFQWHFNRSYFTVWSLFGDLFTHTRLKASNWKNYHIFMDDATWYFPAKNFLFWIIAFWPTQALAWTHDLNGAIYLSIFKCLVGENYSSLLPLFFYTLFHDQSLIQDHLCCLSFLLPN